MVVVVVVVEQAFASSFAERGLAKGFTSFIDDAETTVKDEAEGMDFQSVFT